MRENPVKGHRAVGKVNVLRLQIDVGKKLLLHEAEITFPVIPVQAKIFIEIEGDDIGKAEPLLPVQADQFPVKRHGSRPRGQPQHGGASCGTAVQDNVPNLMGEGRGCRSCIRKEDGGNFFEGFDWRSSCRHGG